MTLQRVFLVIRADGLRPPETSGRVTDTVEVSVPDFAPKVEVP